MDYSVYNPENMQVSFGQYELAYSPPGTLCIGQLPRLWAHV